MKTTIATDPLARTSPTPRQGNGSTPETPPRIPTGRRAQKVADAAGPAPYPPRGGRRPAPDLEAELPVRTSVSLTPSLLGRLRAEVLKRLQRGERADVSRLLRQGAELLLSGTATNR